MPFYRSYSKQNHYSDYSFTITDENGNNPVETLPAIGINDATFNLPVIIGNKVNYIGMMLRNCVSFNQDLTIPASLISAQYALTDCIGYGANIFIKGTPSLTAILANNKNDKDKNKRVNFFYNTVNGHMTANNFDYVLGQYSKISYSFDGNCQYNAEYNIYIYNNWVEGG